MTRPVPVEGDDRLPPLHPDRYTAEQRAAADRLIATPRGEVRGPFVPLLRSPELLDRTQALGEFIRYRCGVPKRLREFAILLVARHWRQAYEWHAHAREAAAAGVSLAAIQSIAAGEPLTDAAGDERAVHAFVEELLTRGEAGDAVYAAVLGLLGEAGVVELTGLVGYYALLAMILNVARTPSPGEPFASPA